MYDMYPTTWRVVDTDERKAERRRQTRRDADQEVVQTGAVQAGMNRRDNGGEPDQ